MSKKFGGILKKLREDRRDPVMRQSDLAKRLELKSYKQIQRYEDGLIPPLDKLIKLCDIFEYDFLSPATGGRCTIIDYFLEDLSDGEESRYKIKTGVTMPSLRMVTEESTTQQQNAQHKPGIADLIQEIKNLNGTLAKGFNLNGVEGKHPKVPGQPRPKPHKDRNSGLIGGTIRTYKRKKGGQKDIDETKDS